MKLNTKSFKHLFCDNDLDIKILQINIKKLNKNQPFLCVNKPLSSHNHPQIKWDNLLAIYSVQ